jgi:hypothetical protein
MVSNFKILFSFNYYSRVICQLGSGLSLSEQLPLVGESGILASESHVRLSCIRALHSYAKICPMGLNASMNPVLENRLWLCQFDSAEESKEAGKMLWTEWMKISKTGLSDSFYSPIVVLFSHNHKTIREASATALASALLIHPELCNSTIEDIKSTFLSNQPTSTPQKGSVPSKVFADETKAIERLSRKSKLHETKAMPSSPNSSIVIISKPVTQSSHNPEKDLIRESIALFISAVGSEKILETSKSAHSIVCDLLQFVLQHGVTDTNEIVRETMVSAGRSLIDSYAADTSICKDILATVRNVLSQKLVNKSLEDEEAYDHRLFLYYI